MFLSLIQWLLSLYRMAIICVCFLLGLAPFVLLLCCFWDETQVWLGDLRVVLVWVVLLYVMICLFDRYRPIALCTAFFTAYVIIRTVPQSINGQTRRKKKMDKLAISHFASSNEKMLAANSATQGCNKVTRKGRKIEQNEVPKPGPQNRQFCGDAWAYPHSKTFHSFLGSSSPVDWSPGTYGGIMSWSLLDWVVMILGEMNGFRLHVHPGCTVYAVHSWWKWMVSVPTSLGEWIHSPWLTWDSWCGKGTAPGCAWCLRGAMLLRGFRLFGVALHREPKGTKRQNANVYSC